MASASTLYQRVFRERIGDSGRAAIARLKAVKRIRAGAIPHAGSLQKYGITTEELNRIRASAGLSAVDISLRPTYCRRGEGTCPRVDPPPGPRIVLPEQPPAPAPTTRRPRVQRRTLDLTEGMVVRRSGRRVLNLGQLPPPEVPAPAPSPAPQPTRGRPRGQRRTLNLEPTNTVIRRSGRRTMILDDSPAPEAPPPARAQAPSRGMTLVELLQKIEGLRGAVQLTPSGRPAVDKNGSQKRLADNTVEQMRRGMRLLAEVTGCSERQDFVSCLRNTGEATRRLRAKYPRDVTYKTKLGSIVSAAKYIPEFKEALGPEAWEYYRTAMIESIRAAEEEAIAATDTATVIPISRIQAKVPAIAAEFGPTSLEHIAARLQAVELIGIRDDLTLLRAVRSESEARSGGIQNFIVPSSGKIAISKYKTSKTHLEPYVFTLSREAADIVRRSLREKPREFLLNRSRGGVMVTKAFDKVGMPGIGVNTIRHSAITDLLRRGGPGAANIRRVAKMFRHSEAMTTRYVRGELPTGDA